MDTRSLIALGMVLSVVVVAIMKGSIDGPAIKEMLMILGSGIVGSLVPSASNRRRSTDHGDLPGPHPSGPNKTTAP